jgi:hypothetical protein
MHRQHEHAIAVKARQSAFNNGLERLTILDRLTSRASEVQHPTDSLGLILANTAPGDPRHARVFRLLTSELR